MNREVENTVLLLVGISIATVTFTGSFTRYVKPSLYPWLAVSAVLLVGLALVAIVRDWRMSRAAVDIDDHEHHHHEHGHRSTVVWMLVLPVVVLAFVVPPALSARAAEPTSVVVSNDVLRRAYPPLPSGTTPEMSLPDVVARADYDNSRFAGQPHDHRCRLHFSGPRRLGFGPGNHHLLRCRCPPVPAPSDRGACETGGSLPDESWVRVRGVVTTTGDSTDHGIPTLAVAALDRVAAPADEYAYLTR
ncbi:TIGR03943 family protein [Mycolicibacterium aubagnense]